MTKLVFLGTGGGRIVTLSQERSTGGVYIEDGVRIHVDPGPGALKALGESNIDPTETDALFISHCHPDHYACGEILIEGMSFRKRKGGVLFASRSVVLIISVISAVPPNFSILRKSMNSALLPIDFSSSHCLEHATPSSGRDFGKVITSISDSIERKS